jgi:hypothetical protein
MDVGDERCEIAGRYDVIANIGSNDFCRQFDQQFLVAHGYEFIHSFSPE